MWEEDPLGFNGASMSNIKRIGRTWLGRELEYFAQSHVSRKHGARLEESYQTAAGLVGRRMRN